MSGERKRTVGPPPVTVSVRSYLREKRSKTRVFPKPAQDTNIFLYEKPTQQTVSYAITSRSRIVRTIIDSSPDNSRPKSNGVENGSAWVANVFA